jgi:phosphoribosylaminoimidazolecarboxamide formyltransferase/IMP cyclohydrolase
MSRRPRALISVSDKTGLANFAAGLSALGLELVSTGGTAQYLRDAGLEVTDVSAVTGFPEVMDGRVKTLHPKIHGGLLARKGTDDAVMSEQDIDWIQVLVVNLYPFEATIAQPDCSLEQAIEKIDVGGPAMLRAGAKNHQRVSVVVDPDDYSEVLAALANDDGISLQHRRRLAQKTFAHTSRYDGAITAYLDSQNEGVDELPERLSLDFDRIETLRYGENPHQQAAFYRAPGAPPGGIATAIQLQGKPLSYNNIADADAALECVKAFSAPACVIVKHANPCGVATALDSAAAYEAAFRTDPTSAFGGIIAFNQALSAELASTIIERQFVEVILAPSVVEAARSVLAKKKNVRVLETGTTHPTPAGLELKSVAGGLLVQDRDNPQPSAEDFVLASKREPTAAERRDLMFAWTVVRFVKSNAIIFCRDNATIGVGAGQMSRVISTRIAALKAEQEGLEAAGAVLASDAFFPFRDGVDQAAEFGVRAIIQPGGSIRDEEVIAAADEHDIAMLFTGERHFRH